VVAIWMVGLSEQPVERKVAQRAGAPEHRRHQRRAARLIRRAARLLRQPRADRPGT
jgi:hypothetical protein